MPTPTSYSYQKAAIYAPGLIAEIDADATVSVDCQSVDWRNAGIAGTVVTMKDALTGPQKTALDAVVAAHTGTAPANPLIVVQTINITSTPTVTIAATVDVVFFTNVPTTDGTLTLPSAAAYGAGREIHFVNSDGTLATNSTVTITRAGSDTVNGGTGYILNAGYQELALMSDGGTKWTRIV